MKPAKRIRCLLMHPQLRDVGAILVGEKTREYLLLDLFVESLINIDGEVWRHHTRFHHQLFVPEFLKLLILFVIVNLFLRQIEYLSVFDPLLGQLLLFWV